MKKLVLGHAILLLLVGGVEAQNPVPPLAPPTQGETPAPPPKFRASTSVVALNVTVTEGNRLVSGLTRQDFEIFEDGVPQRLTFFESTAVPLDLILLLDTSASMRHKMETVHDAARAFMKIMRPGDRGAVVAFNDQVQVIQALTSDANAIEAAIATTSAKGATALHNAIYVALKQFGRTALSDREVRRQAIAVLSDGEDTSSLISFDDVLELARKTGVTIYTIGLQSELALARTTPSVRSLESSYSMRQLARETGAQSYFPASVHDLRGVYTAIAQELESQYSIAYAPTNPQPDGRFRRILVRVVGNPAFRPRTRPGYTAEVTRTSADPQAAYNRR